MKKVIDIKKIIKDKNPKLAKWIPKFLVNYLKRIFHEDEINKIMDENKELYNYKFCEDLAKRFNLEFELKGQENIPLEGGVLFAMNHPFGAFDALALVLEIAPIRPNAKFVVNDVLMNFDNVEGYMVGVNKHGVKTKNSVEQVNNLFESDSAVFMFPAGLVSRGKKGNVEDSEWKKTFIVRAKKHKRDVVPIFIDGELSSFFYRLSNIRKKFGIKANIEMMYLVNENFKLKNRKFTMTVGKPISYKTFDKSKSDKEWAAEVKDLVYGLKG